MATSSHRADSPGAQLRELLGIEVPPALAIITGSGLNSVADLLERRAFVLFDEVNGLRPPAVEGHAGTANIGEIAGCSTLIFQGRNHYYERGDFGAAGALVRAAADVGAQRILLFNAVGGISRQMVPGTLVLVRSALSGFGRTAASTNTKDGGWISPARRSPHSHYEEENASLRSQLREVGSLAGIELVEGIYVGLPGPSYETPAEIRALARFGADVVGMSLVPEMEMARSAGLPCAALSCVTNRAAGLTSERLGHRAVLEVAAKMSDQVNSIVGCLCQKLARLHDAPVR